MLTSPYVLVYFSLNTSNFCVVLLSHLKSQIEQAQQGEESQIKASHLKLNEMCRSWAETQGMVCAPVGSYESREDEEDEEVEVEDEDEEEQVVTASGVSMDTEIFATEDIEEARSYLEEEIQLEMPEVRPKEEIRIKEPEARTKRESIKFAQDPVFSAAGRRKRSTEDSYRKESGTSQHDDRLIRDETKIMVTVPGCEKEDGIPSPHDGKIPTTPGGSDKYGQRSQRSRRLTERESFSQVVCHSCNSLETTLFRYREEIFFSKLNGKE